jgi:hypothetical protein
MQSGWRTSRKKFARWISQAAVPRSRCGAQKRASAGKGSPRTFAFRKALAEGFAPGMTAATAASDPAFDLAAALDRLFAERLVVGLGAC